MMYKVSSMIKKILVICLRKPYSSRKKELTLSPYSFNQPRWIYKKKKKRFSFRSQHQRHPFMNFGAHFLNCPKLLIKLFF